MLIPLLLSLLILPQYVPTKPHSPVGGGSCTGTYSDTFPGTLGTQLATYNPMYVSVNTTYTVGTQRLSGASSVQVNSIFDTGGAVVSCSISDTFQMVLPGAPTLNNSVFRHIGVRATANITAGYTIGFCFNGGSGSLYDSLCIFKNEVLVQQGPHTGYNATVNHTLKIVVTGTTSVLITGFVDGVSTVSFTDGASTITSGNPLWEVQGDGNNVVNSRVTSGIDH